jgi:hypothetical protein
MKMLSVKVKKLAICIDGAMQDQRKLCADENGNYAPITLSLTRGEIKVALRKTLPGDKLRNMWIEQLAQDLLVAGYDVTEFESSASNEVALIVTLPSVPLHKTKFKTLKSLLELHPHRHYRPMRLML